MALDNSLRLTYRLMDEDDAKLLFELDQDEAVMKYLNGGVKTTMDDIVNRFIPRLNAFHNEPKGWGLWQVNTIDGDEFIGWILVRPMHFFSPERDDSDIELGWRFKQCSWGKGYATEAADHIATHIIALNNLKAMSAVAAVDNLGSIAIMKKLGMHFVKQAIHSDPAWQAEVVYYTKQLT
ncbi:GCN5-related N-acetyltransferase [Pseudoalteromonas luteoviolacea B = ATCC 29581]|nr:GCN5-related N-acetyltransferase [Pseudoalteromonas luteoviolacea B = ATCC 29581]